VPWLALRKRNLLDAAVQESYLTVPYAYNQLGAPGQAAEYYSAAIDSFDVEFKRIDDSIAQIRAGDLLDRLLKDDKKDTLTWYWQLQGTVENDEPVAAYDIDGFENSAAEVAALHAQGKHVICYIDVGTAEDFRPDYHEFPESVLGRSNGWPGERWLDIRQLAVLEPIRGSYFLQRDL